MLSRQTGTRSGNYSKTGVIRVNNFLCKFKLIEFLEQDEMVHMGVKSSRGVGH